MAFFICDVNWFDSNTTWWRNLKKNTKQAQRWAAMETATRIHYFASVLYKLLFTAPGGGQIILWNLVESCGVAGRSKKVSWCVSISLTVWCITCNFRPKNIRNSILGVHIWAYNSKSKNLIYLKIKTGFYTQLGGSFDVSLVYFWPAVSECIWNIHR